MSRVSKQYVTILSLLNSPNAFYATNPCFSFAYLHGKWNDTSKQLSDVQVIWVPNGTHLCKISYVETAHFTSTIQ